MQVKTGIDGDRLWSSLMEMAEIGRTPRGGCNRQALTDEDKQGRDLFISWCKDADCKITIDEMGNVLPGAPVRMIHSRLSSRGHTWIHNLPAENTMVFMGYLPGLK